MVDAVAPAAATHHSRIAIARHVAVRLSRIAKSRRAVVLIATETLRRILEAEVLVTSAHIRTEMSGGKWTKVSKCTSLVAVGFVVVVHRALLRVNVAADILEGLVSTTADDVNHQ